MPVRSDQTDKLVARVDRNDKVVARLPYSIHQECLDVGLQLLQFGISRRQSLPMLLDAAMTQLPLRVPGKGPRPG